VKSMTFVPLSYNFPIPNKAEIIINKPQLAHGQLAGENEVIRVQGGYAVIIPNPSLKALEVLMPSTKQFPHLCTGFE
jgi:hypothetical protein